MNNLSKTLNCNDIFRDLYNPWGSRKNNILDDYALLLNGLASKCCICDRIVKEGWLSSVNGRDYCPAHKSKLN
ncbi:MAG: hypothetical protein A3C58_02125 [Candidatus Staskawiczbacteria bacterium RIFCSPHIGHO2_02_FULL_34_10]|uniref:Uncharacterized protein n=1 Tax=Candidatus Staskawiczbacteria bacterium RIFCSPHIGHO2_02_FULL_34_10 TaxID=1802205 RepID=A0A1G2HYJ5_9BACT|nr:MAG: hypothetical protein A3C58_02125 [Candidatus Staskawiczbacteria bacterium RIFCSPHIGHO2_02_FULL_34_10]